MSFYRKLFILSLLAPLLALYSPPGLASQSCYRDRDADAIICPPPGGGLALDRNQNEVCGLGWCILDINGNIKCSSIPGGGVTVDQYGEARCVGGCVPASAGLCQRLKIGR